LKGRVGTYRRSWKSSPWLSSWSSARCTPPPANQIYVVYKARHTLVKDGRYNPENLKTLFQVRIQVCSNKNFPKKIFKRYFKFNELSVGLEASSEPECPLHGLKTTYKRQFFVFIVVIQTLVRIRLDPDPASAWIQIWIQQMSGSGSGFSDCNPKNCLKRNLKTPTCQIFFLSRVCLQPCHLSGLFL
jgi:hypothetical protein